MNRSQKTAVGSSLRTTKPNALAEKVAIIDAGTQMNISHDSSGIVSPPRDPKSHRPPKPLKKIPQK